MKLIWIAAVAAVCVVAVNPALAKSKKTKPACVDQPYQFSWGTIFSLSGSPTPQPNGCAPPVYDSNGRFIGQDPDPNIRLQLQRDPQSGYYGAGN